MKLTDSVSALSGVGTIVVKRLKKLGIQTVGDLLYHAPSSYEDYRRVYTVSTAPFNTTLTLQGRLIELSSRKSWKHRGMSVTEGIFQDDSGPLKVVWFGHYPRQIIPTNKSIYLIGSIKNNQGTRQLVNPVWEPVSSSPRFAGSMAPVYPLTQGLSQWQIRKFIDEALTCLPSADWLPNFILKENKLLSLEKSLRFIHHPKDDKEVVQARRRLAFDELLLLQISNQCRRYKRQQTKVPKIALLDKVKRILVNNLPFTLTTDQQLAVDDILDDMASGKPMQRLLQGEVGSGKTAVAAVVAAAVVAVGYQVLYLVPTEVLARQQYESLPKLLNNAGDFSVGLMTRVSAESTNGHKTKSKLKKALISGELNLIVATHAVLSKDVSFKSLGLVVVDEQHRFGVDQRLLAQQKGVGVTPHLLSMTATPIPRTLQLAFYGDLSISTIHSSPHGTRVVHTALARPQERHKVEDRLRYRIRQGEQVYVVCPLIDPSDKIQVKAVADEYARLKNQIFPDFNVGFLHGKMKAEEKAKILTNFRDANLDILVATSVVEVGLDVPRATIMIIEGAERFGLAQLHQLRGRVGRRGKDGYCLLFLENPSVMSLSRLKVFAKTADGFKLADEDLKLRGPGEWFGVKQSGFTEFKFADLSDTELLTKAKKTAEQLFMDDPSLKKYPLIKNKIKGVVERVTHAS